MKLSDIQASEPAAATNQPVKLSDLQPVEQAQTPTEKPGIADRLWEAVKYGVTNAPGAAAEAIGGIVEPMLSIGSSMYSQPFSGVAGLTGTVLPGDQGQGAKMVEQVGKATTYEPRLERSKENMAGIGSFLGPLAVLFEKAKTGAGEIGYNAAGPTGGALAQGLTAVIPELLGLSGSTMAKKALLAKAVEGKDIAELYDNVGNLLPEIKKSVENSGIAKAEIEQIIPDVIPEKIKEVRTEAVPTLAEDISKEASKKLPSEDLAIKVQPNKEILDAAKELGLENDLLPSHYSNNPAYIEIEQGLKSIPGSQLSANEKALVSELSKKADEFITEFGGTIDKASLTDKFKTDSFKLVNDLEDLANNLYGQVGEMIPARTPAPATSTIAKINNYADELGGAQYLNAQEKKLLKNLADETKPTYARLDRIRKEIGEGLRNQGPFKDSEKGMLKDLYGSLLQDQKAVAAAQGDDVLNLYNMASNSIIERKAIEKQLQTALGKEVSGSITTKAKPAILNLQKGDTKAFDELMHSIPEQLGPTTKREIMVTALNDAFTQASRKERSLSIPGFTDFMSGINRNPGAKRRLTDVIGADTMKRLDLFNTVVSGVRRAQAQQITTGRIMSIPKMFDEQEGLISKLYNVGSRVAKAEGVSSTAGVPGAGLAGVIASGANANRGARSIKADELLASRQFRNLVQAAATNKINTLSQIQKAEKTLNEIKAYNEWVATLDKASKADLAALGGINYLFNVNKDNKEGEK